MPDKELSRTDRLHLLKALAEAFHTPERIATVLDDIGFGHGARPQGTPDAVWREVLRELELGALPDGVDGLRTLLDVCLMAYPQNRTFRDIAERHPSERHPVRMLLTAHGEERHPSERHPPQDDAPPPDQQQAPVPGPVGCRLFVRVATEEERRKIHDMLAGHGFAPVQDYATNVVTRFTLAAIDPGPVHQALEHTDLAWTVVPPGGPDYLLSYLIVQGPDGRNFRFTDTPAATTVAEVAEEALARYPDSGPRIAVTDRVLDNGQGVRLPPDSTLADADLHDGDRLRVGYQTNAGSINPPYRDEALVRAGNQIVAFAEVHPGVGLFANSTHRATVYELEFTQRSFGPPPRPGDDPVEIRDHVVQIEFGATFPLAPPTVFWLTPIFHPNIWPNYECEAARRHPTRQGLVCLGELAEAYQPALDLGQLCQTLVDIAAYRNYSLLAPTGRSTVVDGEAREEYRGNVFDEIAAVWAFRHPVEIAAMGGVPHTTAPERRSRTYTHVIEPYTP